MTGTLWHLALASAAFVGGHVLISSTGLRGVLIGRLGKAPYRGVYALLALASLVWMGLAYGDAPRLELWAPGTALRHLSLTVMVLAAVLVVTGVTTPNPTLIGAGRFSGAPQGIIKVTRHPVMWGIGLWGVVHILANGDATGLIFFGGLVALALGGTVLIDAKKRVSMGEAWPPFAQATSNLPVAALVSGRARVGLAEIGYPRLAGGLGLYLVLLLGHEWVIGTSVLP